MTPLRDALARATAALAAAGVPSPAYDAAELAAYDLGVERAELWRATSPGPALEDYITRRARREPLQHITGRAYFRHLTLTVGPGVFVPRPETEDVAGAAIEAARAAGPNPVVVDLGTGCGAIALALATEVPGSRVLAVEADQAAYDWAQRNCAGSGVALRRGDMRDVFPELNAAVDVVVSNPPYIPPDGVPRDPEVRDHDPAAALYGGGPDGLDALRTVEQVARRLLRPGGAAVVEHADEQGASAPAVFLDAGGWVDVADHVDLAARPRFLTALRASPQQGWQHGRP